LGFAAILESRGYRLIAAALRIGCGFPMAAPVTFPTEPQTLKIDLPAGDFTAL